MDSAVITRRDLLSLTAAGGMVAVAGCLGDDEDVPDPVSLDEGQACDNCDMQIDVHHGPAGQAYYLDDPPEEVSEREDGITYFCSSWCLYSYTLEQEERGTEPVGLYTTDYSSVNWDISGDNGTERISAHLEADAFVDVDTVTYVVDSDVEGAMGSSLIGFSASGDADDFADEYGGEMIEHDEITLELVASL